MLEGAAMLVRRLFRRFRGAQYTAPKALETYKGGSRPHAHYYASSFLERGVDPSYEYQFRIDSATHTVVCEKNSLRGPGRSVRTTNSPDGNSAVA